MKWPFKLNLLQYDAEEATAKLARSCCDYVNPLTLAERKEKYLFLNMSFGQNPSYFKDYLTDVREILEFSDEMHKEGGELFWNFGDVKRNDHNFMCIHVRTTDFVRRHMATNMTNAVDAARDIARRKNISQYLIFGDNQDYMRNMSFLLTDNATSSDKVLISNFKDTMDFYASSELCSSFLMTAANSTFGWWLAFFARDQNSVFYLNDRILATNEMPTRD
ncbi:hypothetical protein OESDEN_19054, partial [Oesophagostomum dentatum]